MSKTLQSQMGAVLDGTKSTITRRKRNNAAAKASPGYIAPKSTAKAKRKASPKAKAEPKPKPLKGQAKWDKMKESHHAWKLEGGKFVPDRG
jgi:hypothetical protein